MHTNKIVFFFLSFPHSFVASQLFDKSLVLVRRRHRKQHGGRLTLRAA